MNLVSSPMNRSRARAALLLPLLGLGAFATALFGGGCAATDGGGASAKKATTSAAAGSTLAVKVIASHLNQPKKLSFAPDGDLVVALSGNGDAPASCTNGDQRSCVNRSGAVIEITAAGRIITLLGDLSSVSSGGEDAQATGPVQALLGAGRLQLLFQGSVIDPHTGAQVYGTAGADLEKLIGYSASAGARSVEADFGRYEAQHNPDHGAGTEVALGQSAIDSDPYAIVRYRDGYAVADAGANDVLFVSDTGRVSVLAVLPTIREHAVAGSFGSAQKRAIEAEAQAVPTTLAVGPDGALYVGELGGMPYDAASSSVYRIGPGGKLSVYARGLTAIADMAFDPDGRLFVLELDRKGLADPGFNAGDPASGEIVEIDPDGAQSTLLARGLIYPTAIAVARDGTIYVSNEGVSSADVGSGGEILEITRAHASA